ncbi:MAG TPA: hypothetical protein VNI84_01380 [Pyrinomonadaceae bacterium]|nr:hypothetical protein [Pyrinomonadaceae bacterium]
MAVSLAEIDSRTLLGLGDDLPVEWCSLDDVHSAVVQKNSVRTMQTRFSDTNVLLSKTKDFRAGANPVDVTSMVGNGVPAFVERLVGDDYVPVRVVNIGQLSNYENSNAIVCAFYSEDARDAGGEVKRFIQFNNAPESFCRIRFDSENVGVSIGDQSALPDALTELIVLEAQNYLIPRVKLKIARNLSRNENERKDAQYITSMLDAVYMQNIIDIKPLAKLWEIYAFRDRNSQGQTTRPIRSGRNFYGG